MDRDQLMSDSSHIYQFTQHALETLQLVCIQQEEMKQSQDEMQQELRELQKQMGLLNTSKETQDSAEDEQHTMPASDKICAQDPEDQDRPRPFTRSEAQRHVNENTNYTCRESLWEMPLFIVTSTIPTVETIVAICLLVFCTFMQGLIIFVLIDNFTQDKEGKRVDAARAWRMSSGHRYSLADGRGHSIVTRLCSEGILEFSGAQQSEYESVDEYLRELEGMPVGAVVCSWCLCLWCLTIYNEVSGITKRLAAMFGRVTNVHGTVIDCVGDAFRLEKIGHHRIIFLVFCSLVGFALAGGLFIAGTLWLTRTDGVTDLILNAAALAFILDLDELLYELAGPKTIKAVFLSLEPIPLPATRDIGAPVAMAVLLLYCLLVIPTWLNTHVARLEDIWDLYCDGSRDFIVGVNPSTGIYYSYHYADAHVSEDGWLERITQEIVFQNPTGMHITTADYGEFQASLSQDMASTIRRFGECRDWTGATERYYVPALAQKAGRKNDSSVSSCNDVSYCGIRAQPVVRLACPATCGCESLVSGHFFLTGCPLSACKDAEFFQLKRSTSRRFDIEPQMLTAMPEWRMYWDSGKTFLERSATLSQWGVDLSPEDIYSKFMELGCDAIGYFSKEGTPVTNMLCQTVAEEWGEYDDLEFRPLRPFCPQSCSCSSRRRDNAGMFCPTFRDPDDFEELYEDSFYPGIQVSGGSLLESEACKQTLDDSSNPEGFYFCKPFAYNGKHAYQFTDSEDTLWVIRWETDVHFDWGARFLGTGVGLQLKSKWVLVSMKSDDTSGFEEDKQDLQLTKKSADSRRRRRGKDGDSQPIVARFFAEGGSADVDSPGPQTRWLPRNTANSDADCAAGNITTQEDRRFWRATEQDANCPAGYDLISSKEGCKEVALAYGLFDEAEEVKDAKDEDDDLEDSPTGCLFYTRRREFHFNTFLSSRRRDIDFNSRFCLQSG